MRIGTLLWLFLAVLAGGALFAISYDVLALEEDLEDLNRAIVEEQTAIRVLQAEWSYLNNPSRLRTLTDEVADLQPVGPGQILAGLDALPYPLPVLVDDEAGDDDGATEADVRALASLPVPSRRPAAPPPRPTVTASAPAPTASPAPRRPATAPVRAATPEPPAPPPAAAPRAGADAIDLLLAGIEAGGGATGQAQQ